MEEIKNTEDLASMDPNKMSDYNEPDMQPETEEPEIVIESHLLFAPQRLEGETYADYRERRLVSHYKLKQMAKGKMLWNSRPDPQKKGDTYRKIA